MFSSPEKNVRELGLHEGMRVADLGAGKGHYAIATVRAMGGQGKVYAVEIKKDLLGTIKKETQEAGIREDMVEVIWGDIEELGGTQLPDGSMDATILSNILFQAEEKTGLIAEARRITKSGGKILVVDWIDSFEGIGPQPDQIIPVQEAKLILGEAGLAFEKEFDAGDHHYGLVYTTP